MRRLTRTFLLKVHRRLNNYFNFDETILLNEIARHRRWKIGDYSYGNPTGSPRVIYFSEDVELEIGKFCCFAEEVVIVLGGHHRTDWVTAYPLCAILEGIDDVPNLLRSKGDIRIGHDVWVGTGAMILAGVTVGNGAVIAARSVVSKDVPSYSVVAGNPARVVKMRFAEEIIAQLNQIQWWNWPIEKIRREAPLLLSGDVAGFVEKHGTGDE